MSKVWAKPLNILCLAPGNELLKNVNTVNILNAIHDSSSLQQAQITELMETMFNPSTLRMNYQQQSISSLTNSTVD